MKNLKLEFVLILVILSEKLVFREDFWLIRRIFDSRPEKSEIFRRLFQGKSLGYAESNPPSVLAAFIYASYLCLVQVFIDSILPLHPMKWPFHRSFLVSVSYCIMFIHQKTCRFCSSVMLLNMCLTAPWFCMMGGVSSV